MNKNLEILKYFFMKIFSNNLSYTSIFAHPKLERIFLDFYTHQSKYLILKEYLK